MWCTGPAGSGVFCVGRAARCCLGMGGTAKRRCSWGTTEHWDPTGSPLGPHVACRDGGCGAEGNADILGPVVWELGWKGEK